MTFAILFVAAYFLGAIPVGYLVGRAKGIDIRAVGSGNIGATNVLRTLGKGPGYAVFFADVLKGFIPAVVARQFGFGNDLCFVVGLGAVFGHSLSPFLGFKGGKGIATGLGAMLGSVTLVGLGSFAIFTLFMALTMTVSLSSIAGAASLPIWGFVVAETWPIRIVLLVMGGYIIFRHRANIDRIRQGIEPKYGQKSPDEPAPGPVPRAICLLFAIGVGIAIYFSHFHNAESTPESAQTTADVPANLNV